MNDRCLVCGAKDVGSCLAISRRPDLETCPIGREPSTDLPYLFETAAMSTTEQTCRLELERRASRAGTKKAEDPWIQTYSGLVFRPFDPDPASVRIGDISHALSNINRFNGHTRFPYSVAAHSIYVASRIGEMTAGELHRRELPPSSLRRLQLLGLLHDAAEAYFGDIVSPIKRHVSVFKTIEAKILAAIFEALNLEPPSVSEQLTLDEFDLRALVTEKRDLHQPEPQAWEIDKQPFDERIVETSWRHVREKFGLLYTALAR